MAAFNRFNCFTDDLVKGKHKFGTDTFAVILTNTAPVATNTVRANITQITGGGSTGYTANGTASGMTPSNASGTEKVVAADVVFTGGATGMGPFQYAVLVNNSNSTDGYPLVAWFDYGSPVTLALNETFTVDFDGTNGLFTIG